MKNPFVRRSKEKITQDWEHHCIVRELQYAYPNECTTPGAYPAFTEQDFQDCVRQAKEQIGKLDLGVEQRGAFDPLVELRAVELLASLFETRMMHQPTAIRMRTEVEAYLAQKRARLALLEERLAELKIEAEALQDDYQN